jgi:hypothetical protein
VAADGVESGELELLLGIGLVRGGDEDKLGHQVA